jgi:dihydroorotate dehydrogenase (NAD+) catalytic subunit
MALAAQVAGADALTCVNTFPAMAIDAETRRPVLGNVTGGLSGPAIKPIALKLVYEVAKVVSIPIIASGGIMRAGDVVEYLLAGAVAVEIGSASLREPNCFVEILAGLEDYCRRHRIEDLSELSGALRL